MAYRHCAPVRDDGNGVTYLTLSAARLHELRPLTWDGWPVSWTEWLIQTHSGNPTIAMQAPPGGEDDTASAAAVFAAISASSARPLPCDVTNAGRDGPDGTIPVSLVLRPPTDTRHPRQAGGPAVPERIRQPAESLPARRPGGKNAKGTGKGGRRSQPPKPAPKSTATPEERPKTSTRTTLQKHLSRTRDAK